MSVGQATQANDRTLKDLLVATLAVLGETLGSLVARPVRLTPTSLVSGDAQELADSCPGTKAVVRGALDKEDAGRTVRVLIDARDATALAGALMMAPEDVVTQRRATGTLDGEDVETFGEVANVLCSGIDQVLRERKKGTVGVRLQDHMVLKAGSDATDVLGAGSLVGIGFKLKVADHPDTDGLLLVDRETADRWNGRPVVHGTPAGQVAATTPDVGSPPTSATQRAAAKSPDEAEDEQIPQAPLRGKLAAFLVEADSLPVVRRSCRRVGLELDRRPRTEIPNPAAHREQVLVLELTPGEDKRFDWCRRLKQYDPSIRVLLLLHHPSRARVLQGFMVKADAILGWPTGEPQLSQKLAALAPPLES